MLSTRNPSRRRLTRIAGIALAAIVALPGIAVADHTDNCPDGRNPCTDFDPQLQVSGPENSFTDVPNGLTLRWGQQDHQRPVIDVTWYIPRGWKFAPNLVGPGIVAEEENGKAVGDEAETCTELYRDENNHSNDAAAFLSTPSGAPSAENLFGGVGMTGRINANRVVRFGYVAGSRGSASTSQDPSIAFLDWDGDTQTARMCMYLYANDPILDHFDNFPGGFVGMPDDDDFESSRQHIVPVTLQRITDEEDPLFDEFGWSIHWDLTSVFSDPFLRSHEISINEQLFQLPSISPGNFNVDDFGNPSGVVFSRSPSTPGNYTIRADFRTCENGMVPADAESDTGCLLDELSDPVTRLQNFTLTPPPDQIRHEFARITGPQTPSMCFDPDGTLCPLGLELNTDNFDVTWEPPPTAPDVEVLGYALVLGEPQSQKSRVFRRIVTHEDFSDDEGFDPDACSEVEIPPEEEDGEPTFNTVCSTNFSFPQTSTDGSTILTGSGKYHVALVTIYTSGHRTDGLCDGGPTDAGQGVACDFNEKPIAIQEPGISEWQVLIRPERWLAFVEPYDDNVFEPSDRIWNRLLLVSFGRQEGEMIIWRNTDSVISFRQRSMLILGSDTGGGLIQMQSPSLAGSTSNWEISAVWDPFFFGSVFGTFIQYELDDPNLNNPADNKVEALPLFSDFQSPFCAFIFFNPDPTCPVIFMDQVS